MKEKCKGIKKDGTPCQSLGLGPTGYCWMHDPAREEGEVAAARKRGGLASPTRRLKLGNSNLKTAEDIKELLAEIITEIIEAEPNNKAVERKGRVLSDLARSMLKACEIVSAAKISKSIDAIDKKLNALQKQIQQGEHS